MDCASSLLVATGSVTCAIPIEHVSETMRPLPVEPIGAVPSFVLGLAIIRGSPIPVVDLQSAMGLGRAEAPSRFVVLRIGQRRVALAVGAVIGIRELDRAFVDATPPLLRDARADVVEAIGVLDAQLLFLLRASRLLPEETWQKVLSREASP